MFSDSCFQCMIDLLEAIKDYDYSDEFQDKLIPILMMLNEIKDELNRRPGTRPFDISYQIYENGLLKNNNELSRDIAIKLFVNAQKKREMSSIDFFDEVE